MALEGKWTKWGTIFGAIAVVVGIVATFFAVEDRSVHDVSQNGTGSLIIQTGDNSSAQVNSPTTLTISDRQWTQLSEGEWKLSIYLKHSGSMTIPKLAVFVKTGFNYLAYDQGNPSWPRIGIDPIPFSPSGGIVVPYRNGFVWSAMPPHDYMVTIFFTERPSVEPEIEITA